MAVGRTSIGYVNEGIAEYSSRLKHYIPFSIQEIKDVKGGSGAAPERQKQLEGEAILSKINTCSFFSMSAVVNTHQCSLRLTLRNYRFAAANE